MDRQRIGLEKLKNRLLRALERENPEEFVLAVFQECGYLGKQELKLFQEQFAEILAEPEEVRRKMKADYLVEFGRYVIALQEYEKILSGQKKGRMGMQFYAAVQENMAAAYARLFEFEEAARCLWESYQTMKSKKVYEKYLRILPLFLFGKEVSGTAGADSGRPESRHGTVGGQSEYDTGRHGGGRKGDAQPGAVEETD